MRARVKWVEEMTFLGESGSGHTVIMDGPPEDGGRNLGVRPMEMLLLGVGGCTAFDVVHILKRARQPVIDCVVELEATRAGTEERIHSLTEGVYRDPRPLRGHRSRPEGASGSARRAAYYGEILLGLHHARQDGPDHPRLHYRGRLTAMRSA